MHTAPPTRGWNNGDCKQIVQTYWAVKSPLIAPCICSPVWASLISLLVPHEKHRVWMQEGARGPPAVADDCTDSPAGDSDGGGFHTSLE